MASINEMPVIPGVRKSKTTRNKHSLRIDMTPMVDLGFLLISFFVMTVQMSRPAVVSLAMPKEGKPSTLGESNALTLLINGEGQVYYYQGDGDKALREKAIYPTTLNVKGGIGKIIQEKQEALDISQAQGEGRDGLMLLIKPGTDASYRQVVDALDEALIYQVKKYALLKPEAAEQAFLQGHKRE